MIKARAQPVISVKVVGNGDPALAVIKSDSRVESVESSDGEMMVTLRDTSQHHGFLIEKLVAAGIQIDCVAPHQLKLEDVFLRLTKGIVQ